MKIGIRDLGLLQRYNRVLGFRVYSLMFWAAGLRVLGFRF